MRNYPRPMTRSRFLLALGSPAALLALPASAEGRLSVDEIAEITALLHQSRSDTLTKLAGLDDKQWTFKPGPERWSAGLVAEHLYLAENVFHEAIDGLMSGKPNPEWKKLSEGKTQMITQVIPDRSTPAKAPPQAVPTGKMSRAEIAEAYSEARSKMVERARDDSQAYKAHIEESGTPLGPLSAEHWLRFAALHNQRHNKQIDEVLADPKFPG